MADFSGDLPLAGDASSGESRGTVYWPHPVSLLPRLFRSPLFLSPPFSSPPSSPATDPAIHGLSTTGSAIAELRHHQRAFRRSRRFPPPSWPLPGRPRARPCRRPTAPRVPHPPLCSHDIPMKSPRSDTKACKQKDTSDQRIKIVNISPSSPSELSGDVSSSEDDREAHLAPSYILKRGTELTGAQKKKMKVKVRSIHSAIPINGCIMKSNSIYGKPCSLDLSREYTDVYLPSGAQTMMLQRHAKNWEVQCIVRVDKCKRLAL